MTISHSLKNLLGLMILKRKLFEMLKDYEYVFKFYNFTFYYYKISYKQCINCFSSFKFVSFFEDLMSIEHCRDLWDLQERSIIKKLHQ